MRVVIFIFFVFCWISNLIKTFECDWNDGNSKPEIIHAIGIVIPPAALITVWYDKEVEEEATTQQPNSPATYTVVYDTVTPPAETYKMN